MLAEFSFVTPKNKLFFMNLLQGVPQDLTFNLEQVKWV